MNRYLYALVRYYIIFFSFIKNRLFMKLYGVSYGSSLHTCGGVIFRKSDGKISIGNNVTINSHILANPIGGDSKTILAVFGSKSELIICDNVGISNAAIVAHCHICIGEGTIIGSGCKIYDTDFHSIYPEFRHSGNTHVKSSPINIGKNVFVGAHSLILKGVTVGEGSVIAAGSIVTRNIPPYEIWGGNPARFIRKLY